LLFKPNSSSGASGERCAKRSAACVFGAPSYKDQYSCDRAMICEFVREIDRDQHGAQGAGARPD
jgi:hypothetical protein